MTTQTFECYGYDFFLKEELATISFIDEWLNRNCSKWYYALYKKKDESSKYFKGRFLLHRKNKINIIRSTFIKGVILTITPRIVMENSFFHLEYDKYIISGPYCRKDSELGAVSPISPTSQTKWYDPIFSLSNNNSINIVQYTDINEISNAGMMIEKQNIGKYIPAPISNHVHMMTKIFEYNETCKLYYINMIILDEDIDKLNDLYKSLLTLKYGYVYDANTNNYRSRIVEKPNIWVISNMIPSQQFMDLFRNDVKLWRVEGDTMIEI